MNIKQALFQKTLALVLTAVMALPAFAVTQTMTRSALTKQTAPDQAIATAAAATDDLIAQLYTTRRAPRGQTRPRLMWLRRSS